MSRSIHQTLKNVFFKKGKKEVTEMCDPNNLDIDVIELRKKNTIKEKVKKERKLIKESKINNEDNIYNK